MISDVMKMISKLIQIDYALIVQVLTSQFRVAMENQEFL